MEGDIKSDFENEEEGQDHDGEKPTKNDGENSSFFIKNGATNRHYNNTSNEQQRECSEISEKV